MRYITPILAIAALTGAALFGAQHAPAAHAATASPAHATAPAATTSPAHATAPAGPSNSLSCDISCALSNWNGLNAKYNPTAGIWRVASYNVWTPVNLPCCYAPNTIEIDNTVNGGCMDWVNGTGMTNGQCGLARSNWIMNDSCIYGTTLTNAYAKSKGVDDVLSAGAVGDPLNMAPDGRCAPDTGWFSN